MRLLALQTTFVIVSNAVKVFHSGQDFVRMEKKPTRQTVADQNRMVRQPSHRKKKQPRHVLPERVLEELE